MTSRSGYPGCHPAGPTGNTEPDKNREGGRGNPASVRTPHGSVSHGCAPGADSFSEIHGATPPWPAGAPEPWEARAVNLAKRSNRDKNRAWRRLKAAAPDVATAIGRDLPALQEHFPGATIYVDSEYLEAHEDG